MILIAYFALAFAIVDVAHRHDASGGFEQGILGALLLTPWILGALFAVLDRPGPVRNWTVSSLLMLFSPALAIRHDWIAASQAFRTGSVPNLGVTVLVNVFFFGSYALYWYAMGPAACPGCGRKALIPLMKMWGQARRMQKTRWCAACGGQYWRRGGGPWLKERRTTWLDGAPDGDLDAAEAEADPARLAPGAEAGRGEPTAGVAAGDRPADAVRPEGPHRPAGASREGTFTA